MAKPRAKKGKGGAGGFKRGVATVGKGKKEKRAEMAEIIQQILATTGKAKAKEKKKAKPSAQWIEEIEGAKAEAVIEEVMLEEKGETEAGALETPTSQEPAEERGGFAEAGWTEPKEQMIEQSRAGKRSRGKEKTMKITESAEIESGAMPLKVIAPEVAKERITVKPIPRIVSGIPGLDEMTDGGLEAKSITLVNGDPGSGKTILGLQFLHAGAKRGEAGLYISFGEPREVLYPRMMAFGMNLQDLEDKKLLFVVEYQPHEIAKIMQEEGGTIYDIVMAYNVKRI
ncbi:MAG: ATPase domain-containing protein, partial [Candidatus Micrarchaeia archaeon]